MALQRQIRLNAEDPHPVTNEGENSVDNAGSSGRGKDMVAVKSRTMDLTGHVGRMMVNIHRATLWTTRAPSEFGVLPDFNGPRRMSAFTADVRVGGSKDVKSHRRP